MSLRKQSSSKINLTGAFSSNDDECQHLERSSNHYRENTRDSQRDNFAVVDDRHSSPSAWIYKGGRTLQDFCRPFMGGTGQVKHLKGADSMKPTQDESVASWRKMAAQSILSRENNADCGSNRAFDSRNSYDDPPHPMFRVDSIQEGGSSKKVSHNCNQSLMIDEPRIVAPNVSKLSPRSVVEVRLQSANECVAILCSVDVLKMRSVFFYEVLNAQEDSRSNTSREQNDIWREPLVIPESSPFEAAAFLESLHEGRSLFKGDWVYSWARLSVAWQIKELILEYAAQIDSHIEHLLLSIRNISWRTNPNIFVGARVAVFRKGATLLPTVVTGIVIEAATTTGYSKLRVLFDSSENRGSNTLQVGGIMSSSSINTGGIHNSVTPLHSPVGNVPSVPHNTHQFREMHTVFTPRMTPSPRINSAKTSGKIYALNTTNSTANSMIGDVGEPLWVQLSHPYSVNSMTNDIQTQSSTLYGENKMPFTPRNNPLTYGPESNKEFNGTSSSAFSAWMEPDEVSLSEAKKVVTQDDKKIFWEMTKTIIELPEISEYCNCSLRNTSDLSSLLKRPEFKILWTAEAADILPKHTASDLVTAAYMHCADK